MAKYYHAHRVNVEACRGHGKCMRNCPTQAIRTRAGHAVIEEELCVDCGNCIAVCEPGAIVSDSDAFTEISRYKYKVVIPSPVLYTQFDATVHPYLVHEAFRRLGFDEVIDIGASSAVIARACVEHLKGYRGRLPLISCFCPAVVRLIQVKYPDLVELLLPLDMPRELTARETRKKVSEREGLAPEDIGIIYVAPCPAVIVSIKQPAEKTRSHFDGLVAIKDVYGVLQAKILELMADFAESRIPESFSFHPGWPTLGSISRSSRMENWLAVSGMSHVMQIMDDIENSRLRNVDFVEALVCMQGCIGGPFNVENAYVARTNSIKQRERYERKIPVERKEVQRLLKAGYFNLEDKILPRPTRYLDTDLVTSIKRMKEIERIQQKLRQVDCGICGAPSCKTFAEDVVGGKAELTDCIFLAESIPK